MVASDYYAELMKQSFSDSLGANYTPLAYDSPEQLGSRLSIYGAQSISINGEEVVLDNTPLPVYNIITSLTDVTASPNNISTITSAESPTLTFTANENYSLPDNITVVGASYTWNKATGVLVLSDAIGDVSVNIVGQAAAGTIVVTWDGDTTGKESILNMFYKISDDTPDISSSITDQNEIEVIIDDKQENGVYKYSTITAFNSSTLTTNLIDYGYELSNSLAPEGLKTTQTEMLIAYADTTCESISIPKGIYFMRLNGDVLTYQSKFVYSEE